MKFLKNNFGITLFVIITLVIILSRACDKCRNTTTKIKIDTVYVQVKQDTSYIPVVKTVYLPGKAPKPFEKWDTLYIPELTEVDTLAILQDYYSFKMYSDTLKNKYGFVLVNDTISTNKIVGRGVKTQMTIPEITKTVTITHFKKNKKWAIGLQTGWGINNKPYLGVGISRNFIRF